MKPVSGYQADDGSFFESNTEAELYEAELELTTLLEALRVLPEPIVALIKEWPQQFERLINAVLAHQEELATARDSAVSEHHSDDDRTEDHTVPVLEQSLGRGEPVSGMGNSFGAEEVRYSSEIDGARSGDDDAPSVRSGEDLAVDGSSRTTEARRKRRTSDIRKG